MIRSMTLFTLSALLAINTVTAEERGVKTIFNGKDLSGWDGDKRLWSVKDGVIHGETTADAKANGNTFLVWEGGETKDFELRLSFRCNATNNSGIQYRSKRITEKVRPPGMPVAEYSLSGVVVTARLEPASISYIQMSAWSPRIDV